MNVANVLRNAAEEAERNKSTILTCGAVVGTVFTVVTTAIGSFKAKDVMDSHKENMTKEAWFDVCRCYIPAALCAGGTIACAILAHREDAAKYAALAALYASDSKKLDECTKKFTHENHQAETHVESTRSDSQEERVRFYDEFNARFIDTTYEDLDNAINEMNADLVRDGRARLDSFYRALGVEYVPQSSSSFGWTDEAIMLMFEGGLDDNRRPFVIFSFNVEPRIMSY